MKTNEELNALKEEIEALNKKLAELTNEELAQISGGEDNALSPRKKKRPPITEGADGNYWGPDWGE